MILKITIGYLQFAGTAFEATEFKSMIAVAFHGHANFLIPVLTFPSYVQNPFEALSCLDCLLTLRHATRASFRIRTARTNLNSI